MVQQIAVASSHERMLYSMYNIAIEAETIIIIKIGNIALTSVANTFIQYLDIFSTQQNIIACHNMNVHTYINRTQARYDQYEANIVSSFQSQFGKCI